MQELRQMRTRMQRSDGAGPGVFWPPYSLLSEDRSNSNPANPEGFSSLPKPATVLFCCCNVVIFHTGFGKFSVHGFCINVHINLMQSYYSSKKKKFNTIVSTGSFTLLCIQNDASWFNSPPLSEYCFSLGIPLLQAIALLWILWYLSLVVLSVACWAILWL
jgi:hypothetical protein